MRRTLRIIIGVSLILIGLAGFVLPVIPGFPLLIIGLELAGIGFLLPDIIRKPLRNFLEKHGNQTTKSTHGENEQ